MTPSVSGIKMALFTLSLHPSSLANSTGLRFELNLSLFELGPGLIWAAIFRGYEIPEHERALKLDDDDGKNAEFDAAVTGTS